MKSKILITGSTSFIGKTLLPLLEKEGYEVYHLVREERGFKREFLWDFSSDLPKDLPKCDVVIHLAAYVNFDQKFCPEQYRVNTVSAIKLAKYSQRNNSYLIFASMAGVHGSAVGVIDKHTTIVPNNHYAMSKYLAEEVIKTMVNQYSILRICGVYGLDGPAHLGINKAISEAFYTKELPVLKGNGEAKRNYICVHDVARWICHLVQKQENEMKAVFYLAGKETLTIREYLEQVTATLLPNEELEIIDGDRSFDFLVTPSVFPFEPITFSNYLKTLTK